MILVSGCHRLIPREQPSATVHTVKKDRVTQKHSSRIHFLSLSVCKVCPCVIIRLDTHISHKEMKVFLLLVTSAFLCLVKMTSKTWPEESDYHHSVRTLACHVITCLCGCLCPSVCLWEGKGMNCWCVRVLYLLETVCTDIWPNRHANTPKMSEKGSVSRVKVSNTAYRAISLSSCHSSDVKKKTSLCPEHSYTNTAGSYLCQVETNAIMKEFRAKPSLKKKCSLTLSGV